MEIIAIEDVINNANVEYDKEMLRRPDIYKESGRMSFCYGWLQSEYKFVYNQLKIRVRYEEKDLSAEKQLQEIANKVAATLPKNFYPHLSLDERLIQFAKQK